eukprot:TRINITY_DN1373_c0_g1_i1.p1 TRINITY_DN1373_c0_g1~~TRINITY_DN1373_c0_g1_i1.p1  ORF type:complete len:448 (-),score=164.21 TRINITY_DN1373_c0_g1_i1:391-1734(-)
MPNTTDPNTGAVLPHPEECGGPEEFAKSVFELNEQDGAVSRERFVALAHLLFDLARSEGSGPDNDVKHMVRDFAGPFGDSEKIMEAAKEIVDKVSAEVVPFVAGEVFEWMDRDSSKGICKDEIDMAITACMSGPEAAFGMVFSAVDKDGNGSLSTEEMSDYFTNLIKMAGKCAHVVVNVFASTFKDDIADGVSGELFRELDANGDDFLDKEETHMMKDGLEMLKQQLAMADQMGPPADMIMGVLQREIKACKEAGDVCPDKFFALFEKLFYQNLATIKETASNPEMVPIPYEKIQPFVESAEEALKSGFAPNIRPITDAYFAILDANSDGIVQNSELMALMGIFDQDTSPEDSFNGMFAMVDSAGNGKISKDEGIAFIKKLFDFGVGCAKGGIDLYQVLIAAVAKTFIKFFLDGLADGEELTKEKFDEIAVAFAENGPEVLLAPMLE